MAEVAADSGRTASGRTSWTFGRLEESFTQTRAGHEVKAYPAVVDEGETVGLAVFGSAEEAQARHRAGVRRLVTLAIAPTRERVVRGLLDGLDNSDKLALAAAPYPSVAALMADCVAAVVTDAVDGAARVMDETGLAALVASVEAGLPERARAVLDDVLRALAVWREVDRAISGRVEMMQLPAMTDLREQAARLVRPGFVGAAGAAQLRHLPRYLRAMLQRRERLDGQVQQDRLLMAQIGDVQQAWEHKVAALPQECPPSAALERVGWLLEEYRVSLWAQQLGTAVPVSDQRIRKALAAV